MAGNHALVLALIAFAVYNVIKYLKQILVALATAVIAFAGFGAVSFFETVHDELKPAAATVSLPGFAAQPMVLHRH
ncbi:hypothetical protein EV652_10943 [Kribbella steppae]|uniref:Uncharacterized protein n=1 Tax=Kribbella steppae TaxID=2512223 RepID=A0A4R2H869_9ACTN|nr:hypothetical protein [Kribbella steppae]TCO23220.1 hypothetical protein EV652_10943 [Kribbella steppae]